MRLVRFLVHNWPLKVGALGMAATLYVAMVSIQATQTWPGEVAIEPVNQPAGSYLLDADSLRVTRIRYIAGPDVAISSGSFRATIDLNSAKVGPGESTLVKIQLLAEDPRVQVVDYQPQQIRVTLDRIVSKTVPVDLKTVIPEGLSKGPQSLSATEVQVTGPSTAVARVSAAQALVQADASGLDVNEDVALDPVDSAGERVGQVQVSPAYIHVRVQIGSQLRSQTVPVSVTLTGTPAPGFYVTAIDVSPQAVAVSGQANALQALDGIAKTEAISISGASSDLTKKVALALPAGVQAQDVTTITVTIHLQSPPSTRTFSVGIVLSGARPDRTYTLSTSNLLVTVGGPTAALNGLDASTLVATASVSGLDSGTHQVTLAVSPPAGISVVSLSVTPITVTVTIGPPPGPSPTP